MSEYFDCPSEVVGRTSGEDTGVGGGGWHWSGESTAKRENRWLRVAGEVGDSAAILAFNSAALTAAFICLVEDLEGADGNTSPKLAEDGREGAEVDFAGLDSCEVALSNSADEQDRSCRSGLEERLSGADLVLPVFFCRVAFIFGGGVEEVDLLLRKSTSSSCSVIANLFPLFFTVSSSFAEVFTHVYMSSAAIFFSFLFKDERD